MKTLIFIVLAVVCLSQTICADTIILAPTGTTLTTGQVHAEAALSPDNDHGRYYWFATGLMQFEFNLLRFENSDGKAENQLGAQWSFLPETFMTPAVSFGVRDATSQSKEGIGAYAAITKHLPVGRFLPIVKDLSVTGGLGVKGIKGLFFGTEAKLPYNLFAQWEFDSRDSNAAAGWQPSQYFRVKASTIRKEFYFGAELVPVQF